MRKTDRERLERIIEQENKIKARRQAVEARLRQSERKNDTRRKILLGALILDRLENGDDEFSGRLAQWLRRELPGFLTRERDRELLGDLLSAGADSKAASSSEPRLSDAR